MSKKKEGNDDGRIVAIKALTHPMRVHLLLRIAEADSGMLSPTEYSNQEEATLNVVAYHMRVLEKYGAVRLSDTKQRRGATEHFYSLLWDSPIVQALLSSKVVPPGDSNESGGGHIGQILGGQTAPGTIANLFSLTVDKRGMGELQEVLETAVPSELSKIREAVKRRAGNSSKHGLTELHVGVAAFGWNPRPEETGGRGSAED